MTVLLFTILSWFGYLERPEVVLQLAVSLGVPVLIRLVWHRRWLRGCLPAGYGPVGIGLLAAACGLLQLRGVANGLALLAAGRAGAAAEQPAAAPRLPVRGSAAADQQPRQRAPAHRDSARHGDGGDAPTWKTGGCRGGELSGAGGQWPAGGGAGLVAATHPAPQRRQPQGHRADAPVRGGGPGLRHQGGVLQPS